MTMDISHLPINSPYINGPKHGFYDHMRQAQMYNNGPSHTQALSGYSNGAPPPHRELALQNSRPPPSLGHVSQSSILSSNAEAGPSAPKKKPPPKRRRESTATTSPDGDDEAASGPEDDTEDPADVKGAKTSKKKKKKANRACFHCQKAHLTCDDSRPCQRCLKRGIADTCTEGHRKKAKYLLDEEELEALKKTKPKDKSQSADKDQQRDQSQMNEAPSDALFNFNYDPSFGSQNANIEYSMLSAILGDPSSEPGNFAPQQFIPNDNGWNTSDMASNVPMSSFQPHNAQDPSFGAQTPQMRPVVKTGDIYGQVPSQNQPSSGDQTNSTSYVRTVPNTVLGPPSPPPSTDSPLPSTGLSVSPVVSTITPHGSASTSRGSSIYDSVTKKYDYTGGYHFLMKYLHDRWAPFQSTPHSNSYQPRTRDGSSLPPVVRFEKNDILRVVRALAIFRPSLIALQMPLTEEDEVFVEKAFQRSLIELEKLISFSGTPTVVWRRTGEICLVGLEFTMLTDWSIQDLVGSGKFIYELFENQSVVEYWEKFAAHAFENSTETIYSHCVLMKPSGEPVPCAFCFSIRRDIFDLPNLVIGQWLPLL